MASESWGGTQLVALGSALLVLAAAAHAADDVASSATEIRPLLIGTIVPELTLKAANGNAFDPALIAPRRFASCSRKRTMTIRCSPTAT